MSEGKVRCRHCGYEFYRRTEYPLKCPSDACQRAYPLGLPKAELIDLLTRSS